MIDTIHLKGYSVNRSVLKLCGERIKACCICGRHNIVSHVYLLKVGEDQLAMGLCSSCALLPPERVHKICHGLSEVFQTRASHLPVNPN